MVQALGPTFLVFPHFHPDDPERAEKSRKRWAGVEKPSGASADREVAERRLQKRALNAERQNSPLRSAPMLWSKVHKFLFVRYNYTAK